MEPINLKFKTVHTRQEAAMPVPAGTITISPKQKEFITNPSFICGAIGAYGGSKTRAAAYKMLHRLSQYPKATHMVLANTYLQLSKTTMRVYNDVLSQAGLKRDRDWTFGKKPLKEWGTDSKFDDHEAVYSFRNGAQLVAVSAERWSVHDGQDLMSIHADEFCFFDPDCYNMLIGRLRGWTKYYPLDKYPNAYAQFFCSTVPAGRKWPYEIFEGDTKRPNSWYIHFTSADNLWIEEGFSKNLADAIGEAASRTKVHGAWDDLVNGRIFQFDRSKHIQGVK